MRKLLAIVLFAGVLTGLYHFGILGNKNMVDRLDYRDDFDSINREFWFIGEWRTNEPAYDKVVLQDGEINLKVQETDRGPYMLSDVIAINKPSLVTIKRHARVQYGNDRFMGGMALLQTDRNQFKPDIVEGGADMNFGNGVALIEYVHSFDQLSKRPGQDVFRFLMPDWQTDGNYKLLPSQFGKWIDEELVLNTDSGQVIYRLDDKEAILVGYPLKKKYIRVFMHSYGNGVGHSLKIDSIEIKVEPLR